MASSDPVSLGDEEFGFPYEPYVEQRRLMRSIHECISTSAVGCFESPTGTGKSLSTICASFTWLVNEEKRRLDELKRNAQVSKSVSDSDDWLEEFLAPKANTGSDQISIEKINKYEGDLARIARSNHEAKSFGGDFFRRGASRLEPSKSDSVSVETTDDVQDEFALKHYDSEEERKVKLTAALASDSNSSDSDDALPNRGVHKQRPQSLLDQLNLPQIFYCSRTHSQLAQFVAEIQKTSFVKRDPITGACPIRCVTLGSRKNMCINAKVTRLKAEGSMSEACLEMQKSGSKATKKATEMSQVPGGTVKKSKLRKEYTSKCTFHIRNLERTLSDRVLGQLRDIEDTVTLAEGLGACPYYASREAVRAANVICLPYNMLLNKEMRESLGIDITGKVIIVDEAHNLIETINQIHSAELSVAQIDTSLSAVSSYLRRYQTQLSGKNLYYVNILCAVLKKMKRVTTPRPVKAGVGDASVPVPDLVQPHSSTLTVNDFLFQSGLDGINLFKLKRHINETNLVNKIGGFAESLVLAATNKDGMVSIHSGNNSLVSARSDATASLRNALELLTCLTNMQGDGRVFIKYEQVAKGRNPVNSSIKFILLNPSVHFAPIVEQARSVLLLGGTMQPFSYFSTILFPHVEKSRLRFISCEHVVPASQVGALIVPHSKSMTNDHVVSFEFTYSKRMLPEVTTALFHALVEICENTPGGVVVFCTSFQYLDSLMSLWRQSKLLAKLDAVKRVFAESHCNTSSKTSKIPSEEYSQENIWDAYQQCVNSNPQEGAVLFSVINGKLSEGINFSDNLARCVVVVGLPYPDVRDPELQEKMQFVSLKDSEATTSGSNSNAGRKLCENMCMKAVNQSVGRAIRHARDYACVVLLDRRYQQEQFSAQLPQWILRSAKVAYCTSANLPDFKNIMRQETDGGSLGRQLRDFFARQNNRIC